MGKENAMGRSNVPTLPPRPGTSEKKRMLVHDTSRRKAEREGEIRDEPGYKPTLEDFRLGEIYRDWVHRNRGTHLDGWITDDGKWQWWWRDLVVMSS